MLRFSYTARNSIGPINGEVEAADATAAAAVLVARGVTPLRIEPAAAPPPAVREGLPPALARWLAPKVRTTDILMLSRQLHTLLRAGVPILRALAGLQESATSLPLKKALGDIRHSLESGIELSMAMAQHPKLFDNFYVSMVKVGEATGRLEEVFLRLFKHLEFELFMSQQVKSALRYPSFVIIAMVIAVGVINVMVVPAFAGVFSSFGADLPLATRILIGSSRFTIDYGWMLGLGAVAAGFGLRQWAATPAGRVVWDEWRLRLPLAGKIVHKATLSRFARSFSLAMKSGLPVEQLLAVVSQTVDNHFIAKKVDGMRSAVERGETILRAAAAAGIFTPVVLQMIAVGEETGSVDELMEEVAELYNNDVQYELKTLSQQIEPILVVFLGAIVLVLALGVFLPVWDLGRVAFKK